MPSTLRILDLFCGAGGCSEGYRRAAAHLGFKAEIVGVDWKTFHRYPFKQLVGDVMELLTTPWGRRYIRTFDFVHASPPCQAYSVARSIGNGANHPMLIEPTREALAEIGVPYVLENVEGARRHMIDPLLLCGSMFGLEVKRHRLFETPLSVMGLPCQHDRWKNRYLVQRSRKKAEQRVVTVFGHGVDVRLVDPTSEQERQIEALRFYESPVVHVHGASGGKGGVALWRWAMGIDWMVASELAEAIPPAYTEHLGLQVFPQL